MIDREGVPDVAEAALQVFLEAHEVLFQIDEVAPDAHEAFCFGRSAHGTLDEVGEHGEYDALALEVDDLALVEQLVVEESPVVVGHAACVVEVALQLSALDVYLGSRIVGEELLGVVELIEYVERAGCAQEDGVEAYMEVGDRACLVVAGAVGVHHYLCLQGAVEAGFLVNIEVDDVACLAYDAGGAGELAEGVAHACVLVPTHLLVVAIYVVVVADAEELLEAFACVA